MSADPIAVTAWSLSDQHANARFDVVADHEPGLLPRLLAPFARRDLAPDTLHAAQLAAGTMHVQIGLDAMPLEHLLRIEGNLRQVIGVRSVQVRREVTGGVRRAG